MDPALCLPATLLRLGSTSSHYLQSCDLCNQDQRSGEMQDTVRQSKIVWYESKVEAGMLLLIALLYIVEVYYSLLLHCNSSDLHTCLISTYLLLSVTVWFKHPSITTLLGTSISEHVRPLEWPPRWNPSSLGWCSTEPKEVCVNIKYSHTQNIMHVIMKLCSGFLIKTAKK